MFKNDSNMEYYARKYEAELVDFLEKVVNKVDERIRRSLNRLDAPIPEQFAKSVGDRYANLPSELKHGVMDKIDNLNEKINYYLEQAEKKGEEGLIDESESLFKEIERMKLEKSYLETQLESALSKKSMTVCEICGAMQSATDTDKRLNTHLEGKLHMGYDKIRTTLKELKIKHEEYRRRKEREGDRERTPSPAARKRRRDYEENNDFDPTLLIRNYSSARFGTGSHMPDPDVTAVKYSNSALE